MKSISIWDIIEEKYGRYTRQIVAEIQALPASMTLSGDDSLLASVWEEWKYQVQRQQSSDYDAYERTFLDMCERLVLALPGDEQRLLWYRSDGFWNKRGDHLTDHDDVETAVVEELFRRVCDAADNEELAEDPDEAAQTEAHEDDVGPDPIPPCANNR